METLQKQLNTLYSSAIAAGLCRNRKEFAALVNIDPATLSRAFNDDPKCLTEVFVFRVEKRLRELLPQQTIIGDNNHHSQNAAPAEFLERLAQSQNQIDELLRQQSAYLRIITNLSERKQ